MLAKSITFFLFLFSINSFAQKLSYEATLEKATEHRRNQLAAHQIMWGCGYDYSDFFLNQDLGTVKSERGTTIVTYDVQILGTYNFLDSTFMWSIDNKSINEKLTKAVHKLETIAIQNEWDIFKGKVKCNRKQAIDFITLAFYIDGANGIGGIRTNNNNTLVYYAFYEVRIIDRMNKIFKNTIPTKIQYKISSDTGLISAAKKFLTEYNNNELNFLTNHKLNYEQRTFVDSLTQNRVAFSGQYWDTTSAAFKYHCSNSLREQPLNMINWRVVTLGDDIKYVLYDVKNETFGFGAGAFEFKYIDGKPKIENEFILFVF